MTDQWVKIAFPIEDSEEIENLHAKRLPNGNYVLDNIPFYVRNISYGDEFRARHVDGRLSFDDVEKHSGHSTYRVKLQPGASHDQFRSRWPFFESLGCGYEGSGLGDQRLYAIDVPPEADLEKIYAYLDQGEQDGFWEFEEGHYGGGQMKGTVH